MPSQTSPERTGNHCSSVRDICLEGEVQEIGAVNLEVEEDFGGEETLVTDMKCGFNIPSMKRRLLQPFRIYVVLCCGDVILGVLVKVSWYDEQLSYSTRLLAKMK
jgi:hypothetical protein